MNVPGSNHHIYLLSGPVQGGKTTYLADQIKRFKKQDLKVMGFLCPGSFSENRRTAFSLENIETGFRVPMGSEKEVKGWGRYKRFFFNPEAYYQGARWIRESILKDPDLLVIDEVGPMELDGGGWAEILEFLETKKTIEQLWVVREKLAMEVAQRWNIAKDQCVRIDESEELILKWRI